MRGKIFFTLIAVLLLSFTFVLAGDLEKRQSYDNTANADSSGNFKSPNVVGQSFKTSTGQTDIGRIDLYMKKDSGLGSAVLTWFLRNSTCSSESTCYSGSVAAGNFTADSLSTTSAWVNLSINAEVNSSTQYFIYIYNTDTVDNAYAERDASSPTYPNGSYYSGATALTGFDWIFATWENVSVPPVNNYTISVVDEWDGSSVNNITVNIDGINYTNSTGNTIYTNISENESLTFNITIFSNNYFNKTFLNHNLSSNNTFSVFQSQINFTGYELITNNLLSGVSFTVGGQTNGTFPLKAGSYNVTAFKDGYYNVTQEFTVSALDVKTVNVTGLYNNILNITLIHGIGGGTINNITGWIYNNANNYNQTFTSNNISNIEGLNYTLFVNPEGYNTNTSTITTTGTIYNYTITLYRYNSIFLQFKNSLTEQLVNNVTIDYWSTSDSGTNSTADGTLYLTLLEPEYYTFRYNSSGYDDNFYFMTITEDTYNNITLYLNPNTTAITIEVYEGESPVENAIVNAQKFYVSDNTYRNVAGGTSNPDGELILNLDTGSNFYKFEVIVGGNTVKVTSPFIITGTTIRIYIVTGTPPLQNYDIFKNIVGSVVFNENTNNFRYTFSDPSGNNRQYCLNTYRRGVGSDTLVNNTCTTGSSGTILHSVTNSSGLTYYSKGSVIISSDNYLLGQDSVSFDAVDLGSAALLAQILLSLAFATAGFLAVELIFVLVPMSIIIGGIANLHSIPITFTAPMVIIGFILMLILRRNK